MQLGVDVELVAEVVWFVVVDAMANSKGNNGLVPEMQTTAVYELRHLHRKAARMTTKFCPAKLGGGAVVQNRAELTRLWRLRGLPRQHSPWRFGVKENMRTHYCKRGGPLSRKSLDSKQAGCRGCVSLAKTCSQLHQQWLLWGRSQTSAEHCHPRTLKHCCLSYHSGHIPHFSMTPLLTLHVAVAGLFGDLELSLEALPWSRLECSSRLF